MDQPDHKSEPKPDLTGAHESARAAKEAAQRLKEEAEKTLRELRKEGGVKSFFEFEKMYFPAFACALFKVFCVIMAFFLLAGTLSALVSMSEKGLWDGIVNLLTVWGGTVFMVILARVWIERALITFNINAKVTEISEKLGKTDN